MIPTRLVVLGISVLAQIYAVFVGGIDAVVMSASPLVVFLLHFDQFGSSVNVLAVANL